MDIFFSRLKSELVRPRQFQNKAESCYTIAEYIEHFYTCDRLQQAFAYWGQEEFEKMADRS